MDAKSTHFPPLRRLIKELVPDDFSFLAFECIGHSKIVSNISPNYLIAMTSNLNVIIFFGSAF